MRPAAAAYYLDQVAQGQEDYYAGEGEEAGRWVGAGTRLLEWGGEVDGDDFVSLLGGAGVRKPRANGVAGFDLTFRAPKASATAASWPARSSRTTSDLRLALVGVRARPARPRPVIWGLEDLLVASVRGGRRVWTVAYELSSTDQLRVILLSERDERLLDDRDCSR